MAARKPRSDTSAAPAKAKAPRSAAAPASKASAAKKSPAKKAAKKSAVKAKAAPKATKTKAAPTKAKAKVAKAPAAKVKAPVKKGAASSKKNGVPAKGGAKKNGAPVTSGEAPIFEQPSDVKILVVDDEPDVLELIVPYLRKQGYTVSQAIDGDKALEKILTDRPNIVVLDVMMPGLSGWEISRYVRERQELASVRIIMATGIGKDTNAATSPLYGADESIDKPFRLDALHQLVKKVIDRIESGQFVR